HLVEGIGQVFRAREFAAEEELQLALEHVDDLCADGVVGQRGDGNPTGNASLERAEGLIATHGIVQAGARGLLYEVTGGYDSERVDLDAVASGEMGDGEVGSAEGRPVDR